MEVKKAGGCFPAPLGFHHSFVLFSSHRPLPPHHPMVPPFNPWLIAKRSRPYRGDLLPIEGVQDGCERDDGDDHTCGACEEECLSARAVHECDGDDYHHNLDDADEDGFEESLALLETRLFEHVLGVEVDGVHAAHLLNKGQGDADEHSAHDLRLKELGEAGG